MANESRFLEAALTQERAWFEALLQARDEDFVTGVRSCLDCRRRRVLARLTHALLREGIIEAGADGDGVHRIELPRIGCVLSLSGFRHSPVTLHAELGELWAHWLSPRRCEPISHPARLLEIVQQGVGGDCSAWCRLAHEIVDSMLNEALADASRRLMSQEIEPSLRDDCLLHRLQTAMPDPALFFEHWSSIGHPLHIIPKARTGIGPDAAFAMFPEFRPTIPVRLAALRKDAAHVELQSGMHCASEYFSHHFPAWHAAWQEALERRGLRPERFVPIPLHPWHADVVLPQQCASQLTSGALALLDGPTIDASPTLSVRTVAPLHSAHAPALKLALGVRLTSGLRTITPRTCQMGPRISRLLRQLIGADTGLVDRLDLLDEEIGIHHSSDGRPADCDRYLSFVARRPVAAAIGDDEFAVLGAALPLPSPGSAVPLLLEVMARDPASGAGGDAFRSYVSALLQVVLRLYLVHGIALEAHGQNMLAVFSREGHLRRFLARDFGGIRIHEPSLIRAGWQLDVHPDRLTVVQDFEALRMHLLHRVYQCHIGDLAQMLAAHFGTLEHLLWREVAAITVDVFDSLRGRVDRSRWEQERRFLFDGPWIGKASVRMRLKNSATDIAVAIPNPLTLARWQHASDRLSDNGFRADP